MTRHSINEEGHTICPFCSKEIDLNADDICMDNLDIDMDKGIICDQGIYKCPHCDETINVIMEYELVRAYVTDVM